MSSSGGCSSARAEDRVAEVVGDALAAQEGQVGAVQVARAPGHHARVQRDHDRAVAGGVGAAHQRLGQLGVVGPVELVPAGRLAQLAGHVLHGRGGGRAQAHRHARAGGGAGHGQLGVLVQDRQHADGAQHHRRGEARAQDVGAQVAHAHVAEHPRQDLPGVERAPVRGHAASLAGAPGRVVERLGGQPLGGQGLEVVVVDRQRGRLAAQALEVDLVLVVAERDGLLLGAHDAAPYPVPWHRTRIAVRFGGLGGIWFLPRTRISSRGEVNA